MFMNAFMKETTQNNCREAIDWYSSVLEFLEWGAKEWKDVPYNQKGVAFKPTFIIGVCRFYLYAHMEVLFGLHLSVTEIY